MRLCKAAKEHLALTNHFAELWANPPRSFNPSYDPIKQEAIKRKERAIKEKMDSYHRELKHTPNNEYYDLMDAYELKLRSEII